MVRPDKRKISEGLGKVYIVKAGGEATAGYITPPIKLILPKSYIGKRVMIQLKECRANNSSIQKMGCVNKYVSKIEEEDWNCVDYYTAHSQLYNSINNLHIVPVTIRCGYKAHRVGVVYSCEPDIQNKTTYFCLQNNWDLEWCGEW